MGQGDRERVRRVVGLWDALQSQKARDHELHLLLVRLAVAGNRLLDLHGRVLEEVAALVARDEQDDTSRLRDVDAGRDVLGEEQFLDRDAVGLVLVEKVVEPVIDHMKARRNVFALGGLDLAVVDDGDLAAVGVDDAVAEIGKPRIYAEYPHGLICPLPRTTYFSDVNCSGPSGPLACSFCVEMPISAPKPNWKPSVKRVLALTYTQPLSTLRAK